MQDKEFSCACTSSHLKKKEIYLCLSSLGSGRFRSMFGAFIIYQKKKKDPFSRQRFEHRYYVASVPDIYWDHIQRTVD